MVRRPESNQVDDLRRAIQIVRGWWKSGPSVAGFLAEVWAATEFDLIEPPDKKANSPYDAVDASGRKIGIKARAQTPYTSRTGKGLNYFAFHQREIRECDAFFLIAFDSFLKATLCVEATASAILGHTERGRTRRLTFTARDFQRFLDRPDVKARIPGSKQAYRWRRFGLGRE